MAWGHTAGSNACRKIRLEPWNCLNCIRRHHLMIQQCPKVTHVVMIDYGGLRGRTLEVVISPGGQVATNMILLASPGISNLWPVSENWALKVAHECQSLQQTKLSAPYEILPIHHAKYWAIALDGYKTWVLTMHWSRIAVQVSLYYKVSEFYEGTTWEFFMVCLCQLVTRWIVIRHPYSSQLGRWVINHVMRLNSSLEGFDWSENI